MPAPRYSVKPRSRGVELQKELIVDLLQREPRLSADVLAERTGLARTVVERRLAELREEGKVVCGDTHHLTSHARR